MSRCSSAPGAGRRIAAAERARVIAARLAGGLAATLAAAAFAVAPADDWRLGARFGPLPGDAKFVYSFGAPASWPGVYRWRYNHAGAPAPFDADKAGTIAKVQGALGQWTAACGFRAVYDGETGTAPDHRVTIAGQAQPDGENVVGWAALAPDQAGLTWSWLDLATNGARVVVDADIVLNPAANGDVGRLTRTLVHEWGHALGLAHSNVNAALMAGPPLTAYNALTAPQPDDLRGCRCLYGMPPGGQAPYACSLPASIDFGAVVAGIEAPAKVVPLANSGNAPLSVDAVFTSNSEFRHVGGCAAGTLLAPGASCSALVSVTAAAAGGRGGDLILSTNDGEYRVPMTADASAAPVPTPDLVTMVEFYNATLDHYFMTWIATEIAILDAGSTPTRWTRTGLSIKAYAPTPFAQSPVCRFYIPPAKGDSHFFGRGDAECAATGAQHPDFVKEDGRFVQMVLPTAGLCAGNQFPVYRVFSNRRDANHRYMTSRQIRDDMVAKGWLPEGDGPDMVVMCAPAL